MAVTVPLYGKLGDIYGRRPALPRGDPALPARLRSVRARAERCSSSSPSAIVQGLGAGGLFALAQATIAVIVPPRDRGRYQGLIGSTFVAGSIAGPALGGLIVDNASWRWIFYVNIPVGLVALAVIAVAIPKRSPRHEHAVDYLGAGAARGGDDVPAARARLGRPAVPVGLLRGPRRAPRGGGLPRGVRLRRAARARADPAVRPVPNANGCGRRGRDRDLARWRWSGRSPTCRSSCRA